MKTRGEMNITNRLKRLSCGHCRPPKRKTFAANQFIYSMLTFGQCFTKVLKFTKLLSKNSKSISMTSHGSQLKDHHKKNVYFCSVAPYTLLRPLRLNSNGLLSITYTNRSKSAASFYKTPHSSLFYAC